jgi:hypothetical protein
VNRRPCLAVIANTDIDTYFISKAHLLKHLPQSAIDVIDGECAYRMEMIDSRNINAQARLSSKKLSLSSGHELEAISDRQSVYDKMQKAGTSIHVRFKP